MTAPVFYLMFRNYGGGMFSDVMHYMQQTKFALDRNMIPVVDMRIGKSFYNEHRSINGSDNPWEYYFEQPCGRTPEEARAAGNVVMASGEVSHSYKEFYYSDEAIPIYNAHLAPKEFILEEVETYHARHMRGGNILGVHFRGGDMATAPGHMRPPEPVQMIAEVRNFLDEYDVDAIFLATEIMEYAHLFRKFFPGKVLLADEFRGTNSINPYRIPYPRENHRYLLGKEAIVTTLLLSKTTYLIAGGRNGMASLSNIGRAAQILNGGRYKAERLIDNGDNPPPEKNG